MPFAATRVDLEIITLSEVSQTDKGKYQYHMIITYMWNLSDTNELIYKAETYRHRKQTYVYQRENGW